MRSLTVRPQLSFTAILVGLLAAESFVLASRVYALHPLPVRAAVIFDLCAMPLLAWWLLMVRPGRSRPRTLARVAVLCIGVCALLFGSEVRLLAAPLELGGLYLAVTSVRKALRTRAAADPAAALRQGFVEALGDNLATRAMAYEFTVFWYAVVSWGQKAGAGFTAYKRSGWTAIYIAVALCSVGEGIGMHFFLRRFGPWVALAGIVLHLYMLVWLLGDLRAMKLRPMLVEGGLFRLRFGLRWEGEIPLRLIESAERFRSVPLSVRDLEAPQQSRALHVGTLGSPNLRLLLREPVTLHGIFGIRRTARELILQVDDPDALAAALRA